MKKRINKKGQDLSIGTLILIVLGIIVLVLLILGFSMGWSNLWEKINIFGGGNSLGTVAAACKSAVTSGFNFDYCDFKEVTVDGKKEWVNCEDGRISDSLENKLTCTGEDINVRVKEKCKTLIINGKVKESTNVNGNLCWDIYTCTDIGGMPTGKGNCDTNQPIELDSKSGIKELIDQVCCVSR